MFKYLLLLVVACAAIVVFVGTEQRYNSVLQSVLTASSAQMQALHLHSPFDRTSRDYNTLQEVQVTHKPFGENQVNDIVQERPVARKPHRGKRDHDTKLKILNASKTRRKTYVEQETPIAYIHRNESHDTDTVKEELVGKRNRSESLESNIVENLQVTPKSRNRTDDTVKEKKVFEKTISEMPDIELVQEVPDAQTSRSKSRDTVEEVPFAPLSHTKNPIAGKEKRVRRDLGMSEKHVNIGLRSDHHLQDCHSSDFKHTFPDVDYAFLGYNILNGFPMAAGHDPGFTYPIFKADYSDGGQTADCRYSVPRGLVIVPDVSCITSFSSTTVHNRYDYDKALSVSASVSGGGWGVSFSASAGYKQTSSEIVTGESVFILSTANCHYYFSKIISDRSPMFDDVFLQWVYKLNATEWHPELYFNFFETFGTHFPTEVTFGARFTYEYKMNSKSYESKKSTGVDVGVQASYSGLFSAGGGFNMDSSQKQAASEFSKDVTTRTITVGAAPPANGDAMTWASEVKNSPVPTAYKLSSLEQLFSERYMGHLNIDHTRISGLIATNKHEYCLYLLREGKVDSCENLDGGIEMKGTRLFNDYYHLKVSSVSECIEVCIQELACVATTFCSTCTGWGLNRCYLFSHSQYAYARNQEEVTWQSNLWPEKITTNVEFRNTTVVGIPRGFKNDNDKRANRNECEKLCNNDKYCVAYSHCDCPNKSVQCHLFSKEEIRGLRNETGTTTVFI